MNYPQVLLHSAFVTEHLQADWALGLSAVHRLVTIEGRFGLERPTANLALLAWIEAFI